MKPIKILFLLFVLFGVLAWGKPRGRKKKNKNNKSKKAKPRDKDEMPTAVLDAIKRSQEICEITQNLAPLEYGFNPTQAPTDQPTRVRASQQNKSKKKARGKRKEQEVLRDNSDDEDDGERTETEEPLNVPEYEPEGPDVAALMGDRLGQLNKLKLDELRTLARALPIENNYDNTRRSSIIGAIMATEFPVQPRGPPPQPSMTGLSPQELLRRNPSLAQDILGLVLDSRAGEGDRREISQRRTRRGRGSKNKKGKTTAKNSRKRPRDDERHEIEIVGSEQLDNALDVSESEDGTININLESRPKRHRSNNNV